ncbi:MAG: Ig-like domain-containing protein [Candidatus Curtissbacteria bacterium]|nr:Ig-like domain-containing protein [Candidatus Curtissbacteria bacterium]
MAEIIEKRGPIEKTQKGWPINPLGVVVLIILGLIIAFLIAKPLLSRSLSGAKPAVVAQIAAPQAGQIVKGDKLGVELSVDNASKVAKIQFWAKTYVDNKWEIIGEVSTFPFKIEWVVPSNYQNKAVAVTAHIYLKDGNVISDPGGWREGIIILQP